MTKTAIILIALALLTVAIKFLVARGRRNVETTPQAVSFDTAGWVEEQRTKDHVTWCNSNGDALSLGIIPPISLDTSDRQEVLDFARNWVSSQGGGLVSVDVVTLKTDPAMQVIYKQALGSGYAYRGTIFCPFRARAIMVQAAFNEHGTTGVREAVVSAMLWKTGQLELDSPEPATDDGRGERIPNWFFDPYDPDFDGVVVNSLSDDEKYDSMFTEHPLSALRRTLANVRETMKIEELPTEAKESGSVPS